MIKIANAPCSWGALEFGLEGEVAGYAKVLNEMKDTGYEGTELGDWGFMPTDPAKLREELTLRNLAMVGAFVPAAMADPSTHGPAVEKALKVAGLMHSAGFPKSYIVLADDNGRDPVRTRNAGRIKDGMGLSKVQWKEFAAGADKVAKAVKDKYGMETVFHHHCAGFVETPDEVEMLMEKTSPELLGLCIDFGHYVFGGGDPVKALKKYGSRIRHVHFKDCHADVAKESRREKWDYFQSVSKGVFCELGKGQVDFKAVVKILKDRKYDGWITVEQDILPGMGNPKECAGRNREFIRSLGL